MRETISRGDGRAERVALALSVPVIVVDAQFEILFVNPAAEEFFGTSASQLYRQRLSDVLPPENPLLSTLPQVRAGPVAQHGVPIRTGRGRLCIADVTMAPMTGMEGVVALTIQTRGFTERLDRQLVHRDSTRSLNGLAAVLAHEIKNPLSGIRGAAQLLEESAGQDDRELARLIRLESDRIRGLIDRMEACGDTAPVSLTPVNVHEVLDHVKKLARAGFARHASLADSFDPSLPLVPGDRDRLIQLFVNLVRNAADALPETGGQIVLATAFRPGMRVRGADGVTPRALPIEITVRDNGVGIAPDLVPRIFDPFVTTKSNGVGLGLALAAKIVSEHEGVIECDCARGRTEFRVLLPVAKDADV